MIRVERFKSILVILIIVSIFLISELIGGFLESKGYRYIFSIIYPSFTFWISLIIALIIEKKDFIDRKIFNQIKIIAILFLWTISIALLPLYLPIISFRAINQIYFDRFEAYRIFSVAFFKTGWFLIIFYILSQYCPAKRA